jgi:hypothetical protein
VLGGAIQTADLDADGRDEVVLSHPPSLYVLDHTAARGWHVAYHDDGGGTPLQSRSLVAEDVNGDGVPEIFVTASAETLLRYDVNPAATNAAPPQWTEARPLGPRSVRLRWRAPGADSVQVFAGAPDAALDPLATQADSLRIQATADLRRYALRAWSNGIATPLSETRVVRPHVPATVAETATPTPRTIRLRFTEPLDPATRPDQFALAGRSPERLVPDATGRAVVLRFARPIVDGVLRWTGVHDADGLAVAQTEVPITPPASANTTLFIQESRVLDPQRVQLTFSAPLNPDVAETPSNYRLSPRGRVSDATVAPDAPDVVTLQIENLVVGATGQDASLTVVSMEAQDGAILAKAGRAVSLTQPASNLADVFVYPNPYRAREHGGQLTIAGLPLEATVRIYTPDGRLVQVLETRQNTTGGAVWDLRDRRGQTVPSGVYLIRVEAPGNDPVLRKAALIR